MTLSETNVNNDPFIMFHEWFTERSGSFNGEVNSFSLATAGKDMKVSVRTVLLKGYDKEGFVFYTNYNSRKGSQLEENRFAAMLFYWPELNRQIRIEGTVKKVPGKMSDDYFRSRPRGNQLSALASDQSQPVSDRSFLEKRFEFYQKKFEGRKITRPRHWGGFRLQPAWFEFWQAGENRLHDRISYTFSVNGWKIERLSP